MSKKTNAVGTQIPKFFRTMSSLANVTEAQSISSATEQCQGVVIDESGANFKSLILSLNRRVVQILKMPGIFPPRPSKLF